MPNLLRTLESMVVAQRMGNARPGTDVSAADERHQAKKAMSVLGVSSISSSSDVHLFVVDEDEDAASVERFDRFLELLLPIDLAWHYGGGSR